MNFDPGQLPPLRPTAPPSDSRESDRLAGGPLLPNAGPPYVSPLGGRTGAGSPANVTADSTSIDHQTRVLMDGMQALGEREALGASAARLGALAAQIEDGSLMLDPYEIAQAMAREEGL